MLTAQGRATTERPGRYLIQLCRHLDQVGQLNPCMQVRVECSSDRGVIDFGWGRCTLNAVPDALIIRAEAHDDSQLQQLMQHITERLERIGARDGLRVVWSPPPATPASPPVQHGTIPRHNTQRAGNP